MPHPTAVINVVGLSESLIGGHCPRIADFARRGAIRRLKPVLPAVTCSVQSSMLTGSTPREHGIVGNGWFDRELGEVHFWKQSNRLVHGEKVWETARRRDPSVTCANMFWWFNMDSTADFAVTPRPQYAADGRKIPDCWTQPADLRDLLQARLGPFPLFQFWGPNASIVSSRWIAESSKIVYERHSPTLMLIYLPHLDYALQKMGPSHASIPRELAAIDRIVGDLIDFFDSKRVRIMLLSEYGIEAVDDAVHVNRVLREAGMLRVREERGTELLDSAASGAFAVADHQVAHVYIKDARLLGACIDLCRDTPGVAQVLDRREQRAAGIDHARSGDLVLVASPRHWFSYDWWLDPNRAPDFARTVDIHRKPGYDPLELFINPEISMPKLRIAWKLLMRKLGFRTLLDVIPLDASLVRGSHGRVNVEPGVEPVLIATRPPPAGEHLPCTAVRDVILSHLFDT